MKNVQNGADQVLKSAKSIADVKSYLKCTNCVVCVFCSVHTFEPHHMLRKIVNVEKVIKYINVIPIYKINKKYMVCNINLLYIKQK